MEVIVKQRKLGREIVGRSTNSSQVRGNWATSDELQAASFRIQRQKAVTWQKLFVVNAKKFS